MELTLLDPKQKELGYQAFLKGDKVEIWLGDIHCFNISAKAGSRAIRGSVWQDSFLRHLMGILGA